MIPICYWAYGYFNGVVVFLYYVVDELSMYTIIANTLSWHASGASLPVNYYIYRDAALTDLVATLPGSQTHFTDEDVEHGKRYTYYIVGINEAGTMSEPVEVVVQKNCKKGSRTYIKYRDNIIVLKAQIKVIRNLLKGNWIDFEKFNNEKELKSFTIKMKQAKSLVLETLKNNVASRDDDNILCFMIWEKQGSTPAMTYKALQAKLISGKFSSPESIGRVRRSLQQKYSTLRGKLYDKRHQADERLKKQYKFDF